ncbi:hypothetical protein SLU01_14970 [Sporosarcina luteola]|uniref:PepSY domain-containing protein n=1 Tax=Sporosarcina luteola TaxID=582850 RepID=A0A511Z6V8_9BACL|nr:PepSY domain-containing protein [Sporosarcina luteola]GEN83185.1 hypothetical protein SLU01_14970 [Sporosarcina luteola]
MNIWKKPWFIPIVLTIIIIVAGQLYTSGKLTKAETLTKQEIHSQLEKIYGGAVSDIVLDGSIYQAKVSRDGSEYAVKVEADTGKVLSLVQTKETTPSEIVLNEENTVQEKQTEEEKSGKVTPPESDTDTGQSSGKNTSENIKPKQEKKPNSNSSAPANEQKNVLISEKQAANIGMAQLPSGMVGEVDDVDFVKTTDGGYYLVQIDIDTDDDLDEVTYQIHAISGKVLTVTWDD